MNPVKKFSLIGGALVASSALLFSFTNDNGGDKNKKYQIIHQSDGKVVTHDTVIPMSSSYTPEQFVADMGISSENIEVVTIPDISKMLSDGKMMKTFVHEVEIDGDDNGDQEKVEIKVEIDDEGNMTTKKTVNGEEVEMTEEELKEIKSHHGDHGKVIQMRFDDEEIGDKEERVEISVEIDDEGNKTIKKVVNGEEVEMTEEELEDIHMFEMTDGDDMNVFIHMEEIEGAMEEMEIDMKEIEFEMEKLIEEGGDDVKIITKRIDMHSDEEGTNFDWESEDGEQRIMVMSTDDDEDHTIVLVTENYDESTSGETKMMFETTKEEMDVYPNPNDGAFTIRYESDEDKKTSITVTDATGKKVFEEKLGKFSGTYEKELNLKKMGSGMYTITIQNGNNKEVQKVMIK